MLTLLLELPNPGGRGRRMVASASGLEPPADVHGHARTGPEGSDFLAIEMPTIQRLESQAVRDDADRVMLIGVDTSHLSIGERDRIRDALRQLHPEISRIVASIDWSTAGHETVIRSAALADLLRGPAFSHLPTNAEVGPPRGTGPAGTGVTAWLSKGMILGTLGLLAGSATVIVVAMTLWPDSARQLPPLPTTPDARLRNAADAMLCSEPELRAWIESATGKRFDDFSLNQLSTEKSVGRFFALRQTTTNEQFREFVESLNPSTAADCKAVRDALRQAHEHLAALKASAASAGKCGDWRHALTSPNDPDLDPLPQKQVAFIESLVAFGSEDIVSLGPEHATDTPFFQENDDRRFDNFARFFKPARQAPIRNLTRITYTSTKDCTALFEAVTTMPLPDSDRKQLRAIGEIAAKRTNCSDIEETVKHFIKLCESLGRLPRPAQQP